VLLPELALSGYNFQSLEEISPFLENSENLQSSITFNWCSALALKLKAYVFCGYAETY
jgi:protein N-terminal amidase